MIKINFKNLEKSELATDIVLERLGYLSEKFPDLTGCKTIVTLEMENSSSQAGEDLFGVKLNITSGRYKGITVKKSNPSLYKAFAEVVDHMLEVLIRHGDKKRVVARNQIRSLLAHKA